MKRRLYLVGVNQRYGDNVYLPYAVGLLWANARRFEEIIDHYELCGFLYLKESIDKAVSKLESPDLIGISHYIWNAQWNLLFAQKVKERWPHCKILVGGVSVYDESPKTLDDNPQLDFAIYGEGEGAFVDFLIEYQRGGDPSRLGSLIWRDYKTRTGERTCRVNPRRPFTQLEDLRSPYLDGLFDSLLPLEGRWQFLSESNRGCPYFCSFCEWGQAALTKVRPFPMERVLGEIEWLAKNRMEYFDQCDANFGILKQRDVEITKALVKAKERYGHPRTFRTSFAKNSNEVIWEIANLLHKANMLKAVTLAMQSMDEEVLVNVKRKNIKFDHFGDLVKRYEDAGIPTYTELILGLPGETLETWIEGIDRNLEAGQHSGLFTYLNILLPNTEQDNPEYKERYGLQAIPMQAMLTHGTPDSSVPTEIQYTVVGTKSMPHEDWKQAYLYGKVIEVFHCLGLLQHTAIYLHRYFGLAYEHFYQSLQLWLERHRNDTVAGQEYANIEAVLDRALRGGSWDLVDSSFGPISWPPEEFAFARICCQLDQFYQEIWSFVADFDEAFPNDRCEVWQEQQQMIVGPELGKEEEWTKECVWYSRKGSRKQMVKGGKE